MRSKALGVQEGRHGGGQTSGEDTHPRGGPTGGRLWDHKVMGPQCVTSWVLRHNELLMTHLMGVIVEPQARLTEVLYHRPTR